jgi:hypothetical protein
MTERNMNIVANWIRMRFACEDEFHHQADSPRVFSCFRSKVRAWTMIQGFCEEMHEYLRISANFLIFFVLQCRWSFWIQKVVRKIHNAEIVFLSIANTPVNFVESVPTVLSMFQWDAQVRLANNGIVCTAGFWDLVTCPLPNFLHSSSTRASKCKHLLMICCISK